MLVADNLELEMSDFLLMKRRMEHHLMQSFYI